MKAYIISIGPGNSIEATRDIYKRLLSGVVEELQNLAGDYPKGFFKTPNDKGKLTSCELSEEFLKEHLKEDSVHIAFGPRSTNHFWANINVIEIS